MTEMIEYCGECIHCVCDIPTCTWECDAGNEAEWDDENECFVCDDLLDLFEAEELVWARREDMLCEQGKNEAKGVSDEIY